MTSEVAPFSKTIDHTIEKHVQSWKRIDRNEGERSVGHGNGRSVVRSRSKLAEEGRGRGVFLGNDGFENTRATAVCINLSRGASLSSSSLSLSFFLSLFLPFCLHRHGGPLALENGQYPCKLNCADVSVKLKRMENRFSRRCSARARARPRLFRARACPHIAPEFHRPMNSARTCRDPLRFAYKSEKNEAGNRESPENRM